MSESLLPEWVRALLVERYPRQHTQEETVRLAWRYVVFHAPTPSPADECASAPLAALLVTPPVQPPAKRRVQTRAMNSQPHVRH